MARLRRGPMEITMGPIGRCVKRGWCSVAISTAAGKTWVLYSLTEAGRALLDAAPLKRIIATERPRGMSIRLPI